MVLSESSLENVSDINTYGQVLNSVYIWIALLTIVVLLWRLPKLKGWMLQKKILQLAKFTVIFSVLGMVLCLLMYLASIYMPNAELFLIDKDGRFNLTFITAIVAGIVFFARQEEEERKRKLELLNSFYNELVEVVTEYIYAVEIVANDFFELNLNIFRKEILDKSHQKLKADWQEELKVIDNYPSDQQEYVMEALEKEYKQKAEMSLKRKRILVDLKGIKEIIEKHQVQCKFILEDLNKRYTRLTIILNSEGISEDVCTDCENLNDLLNKIRKDYDVKLRDCLVREEVTTEFVKLTSMMEVDIKYQKMIVENKLKNLIKETRYRL